MRRAIHSLQFCHQPCGIISQFNHAIRSPLDAVSPSSHRVPGLVHAFSSAAQRQEYSEASRKCDENPADKDEADVFGSVYRQSRKPRRKLMSVENVNDKKVDSRNTNSSFPLEKNEFPVRNDRRVWFVFCAVIHCMVLTWFFSPFNSGGCFNGWSWGGGLVWRCFRSGFSENEALCGWWWRWSARSCSPSPASVVVFDENEKSGQPEAGMH